MLKFWKLDDLKFKLTNNMKKIQKPLRDYVGKEAMGGLREELIQTRHEFDKDIDTKKSEVGANEQTHNKTKHEKDELNKESTEALKKLNELKAELEDLSKNFLTKILGYFKIKKISADIKIGEQSYEQLKTKMDELRGKIIDTEKMIQYAKEELENIKLNKKMTIEERVEKFQLEKSIEWAEKGYTKKELSENFTEENLAKMNLEEFTFLLQRFPGDFVTHVTRQNIRDHHGFDHTKNIGERSYGFEEILKDGRLHSTIGMMLYDEEKEEKIAKYLGLENCKNRDDAEDAKTAITHSWSNRLAIHCAVGQVGDAYYGSESGNEIFMAFPSALIASQYHFDMTTFNERHTARAGTHNDQWIWINENRGININAGLTFIPKDTLVDKNTGSKYELDKNNNPIINEKAVDNLLKIILDKEQFKKFANDSDELEHLLQQLKKCLTTKSSERPLDNAFHSTSKTNKDVADDLKQKIEKLQHDIANKYNIDQKSIKYNLSNFFHFEQIARTFDTNNNSEKQKSQLMDKLGRFGATSLLYKFSENTTTTQEYWEEYFLKHPNTKPNKIIYYENADPTTALNHWRAENNIIPKITSSDAGFKENVGYKEDLVEPDYYDRFMAIVDAVIDKRFPPELEEKDK